MFTYFKSAFKNAKPQLLITLIYALIAFAVIAVVYLLANFQLAKYAQTIAIYSQFGQKPPVDAYLKVIAVLLIAAVVSLFVLVQIFIGITNVMKRAMSHEKVKFTDLFIAFKKGNYLKSVLIGLVSIAMIIVLSLLTSLLYKLFSPVSEMIMNSVQSSYADSTHLIGIAITTQSIIIIVVLLIKAIITWLLLIPIFNFMTSFVESTNDKVKTHLANGFKAMKNGQKTFFKFFIGILLLNLIIILFNTQSLSQSVAENIIRVYTVMTIILFVVIHAIILMGIVQYYLKRGQKITKDKVKTADKDKKVVTEPKNTKVENGKVTTSVETKTEKAQDSLNDNTTKTMTSDKPEDNQPK
ncbi:transcriptional regulator [Staphylococcus aureus]|uniref:transcriptional regulator n=1 Tax=Staphylococcus aureus TaxID=1280 RepID=UPI002025EFD5|nr:transcriptional regulator [Staphylococcus aureus]MCL9713022.1 transcriptional regulator [Staphylococcus aureus]MCL9741766.1 transcriptional regulator [Staphylococcus aureus]